MNKKLELASYDFNEVTSGLTSLGFSSENTNWVEENWTEICKIISDDEFLQRSFFTQIAERIGNLSCYNAGVDLMIVECQEVIGIAIESIEKQGDTYLITSKPLPNKESYHKDSIWWDVYLKERFRRSAYPYELQEDLIEVSKSQDSYILKFWMN